jgi:hypothetical protein
MDAKLRQLLELALRPETGQGESEAALAAARRLVSKHGMDVLGACAPERVVYRDKVVYRKPNHSHSLELTLTIPARFHHTMMERIFQDAEHMGCDIKLISCTTKTDAILSGTVIKFKVMGAANDVKRYGRAMDSLIDEINRRQHTTPGPTNSKPNTSDQPKQKQKGWFAKLFGAS